MDMYDAIKHEVTTEYPHDLDFEEKMKFFISLFLNTQEKVYKQDHFLKGGHVALLAFTSRAREAGLTHRSFRKAVEKLGLRVVLDRTDLGLQLLAATM